jgi:putative serine protease PepD
MSTFIRFDQSPGADTASVDPAARAAAAPTRRVWPGARLLTAGLLVLAVAGASVGGGVVGASLASRSTNGQAAAAQVPQGLQPVSFQPQAAALAMSAADVFQRVNPSVVQVVVAGRAAGGPMGSGAGSGFVVDQRGYILTNQHVVEGARAVSIRFSTGATREAQVVGTDRGNDLALLRVDLPQGIPAASLGNSDQLRPGDTAIAIGSPFGLEQSLTQGIISAVDRTWSPGNGRVRRNLLQTDAPINPGNSGGPLLNASGEVIGVTSMIESPVRGNVGVGFAIPINTASELLPRLESGAQLEPVWLGIAGQPLDQAIAQDQGLSVNEGVLITNVLPNGPAARAGLRGGQTATNERIPRGGDVIVALNGATVNDMNTLSEQLAKHQPGDTITVGILRDGQRQDVRVALQAWPEGTQ